MAHPPAPKTLVYSCSGCSSAAQLANHLAVRLDRQGDAEMSCIAGLGGQVKSLIRTARNAQAAQRPILVIDGCPLACAKHSLAQHGVAPTHHLQLAELGVRKLQHQDFDPGMAASLLNEWTPRVRAWNRQAARPRANGSAIQDTEPCPGSSAERQPLKPTG